MEGIAGIANRMAEIRTQLAAFQPPRTEAVTGPAFESAFERALSEASAALRTPEGVPAELAKYGNGRIPEGALARVGDTRHRLWAPAAASLEALMRAAREDGGREARHERPRLGMAADLDLDARARAWMRANAGRFGFTEDTPREPWHWKYG